MGAQAGRRQGERLDEILISSGYRPGAIGRITELHAGYYHRHWGFGLYFERKVAAGLAEFLGRFDPARDGLWLALLGHEIVGSIVIDGAPAGEEGAHLRWFIVDPGQQGLGIGKRLLKSALDFSRKCGFPRVHLWTFAGLDAARRLYETHGFVLRKEHEDRQWGVTCREQLFEWTPGCPSVLNGSGP